MAFAPYSARIARLTDAHFLRLMLFEAAAPPGRDRPPMEQLLSNPQITAFVDGWGRPGDHGVVAEAGDEPVGAAWSRIFPDDDLEGGFVGGETPELLIAITPDHRGKGLGGRLLGALLARVAEEGHTSIGCNVLRGNAPAVALFRSHGFVLRRERDGVLTMQAALAR